MLARPGLSVKLRMGYWRLPKMVRIFWVDRVTAGVLSKPLVIKALVRRKVRFFGHVIREYLVVTEKRTKIEKD